MLETIYQICIFWESIGLIEMIDYLFKKFKIPTSKVTNKLIFWNLFETTEDLCTKM